MLMPLQTISEEPETKHMAAFDFIIICELRWKKPLIILLPMDMADD